MEHLQMSQSDATELKERLGHVERQVDKLSELQERVVVLFERQDAREERDGERWKRLEKWQDRIEAKVENNHSKILKWGGMGAGVTAFLALLVYLQRLGILG